MIMSMYKSEELPVICITNRHLVKGDFISQIEIVAKQRPKAIILREKDLSEEEYGALAKRVLQITERYQIPCILHTFFLSAIQLYVKHIHVPLSVLEQMTKEEKAHFSEIGVSIHSIEEAKIAQTLGATYITAGHIFATDCKRDIPPRGTAFLKDVCNAVVIPVYAIGGIKRENKEQMDCCRTAGAAGLCIMSGFMINSNIVS